MVSERKRALRPTVAVIIPYYNGSRYIDRAAKSVLAQTVPPHEFVVVNDGSQPEEARYLHDVAATYGFRVIDQENGGQGSARNAGVAATTSDYISFLDQDDFYLDTHIETLLNAVPEGDRHLGWIYGDLFEAEDDGSIIRTTIVNHLSKHPKTSIHDLMHADMFVLPSASLITRKSFEAVGGFDTQFSGYEDDDLFLRIFRKGFTNYFTAQPVTVWCINNASTSFGIRMIRSRMRYFKKLAAMFPDNMAAGRPYMLYSLIPRFHIFFLGDAHNAIVCPTPLRDAWLKPYADEMLDNFKEYVDIACQSPSVSPRLQRRLRWQYRVLATKSVPLIKIAFGLINGVRRIRSLFPSPRT